MMIVAHSACTALIPNTYEHGLGCKLLARLNFQQVIYFGNLIELTSNQSSHTKLIRKFSHIGQYYRFNFINAEVGGTLMSILLSLVTIA